MADEDQSQTTTPAAPAAPQVDQPIATPAITPKDIEGKTPDEIVKLVAEVAEKAGASGEQVKQLKDYQAETQPIIQFLIDNPDAMTAINEIYKKKNEPIPTKDTAPVKDDVHKKMENDIFSSFEREKGFTALDPEKKKDLANRIGQELMEMRDPGGKKTYNEVISEIPLDQLNGYLDKAHTLATVEEQRAKAREEGASETQAGMAGVISSMPSSSVGSENVNLTTAERTIAAKMGVTPEKYLERKKQIAERNNRG